MLFINIRNSILQMLIKTQVKRRAQTINQYVSSLKTKVYNHDYKQAIEFLKKSRDTIYNSYMAPYNPNGYLLDSLKTKNQKLLHQKQAIQQQIMDKLEDINKIKQKRGYTKYNMSQKPKNAKNSQFLLKLKTDQVSTYITRLSLKLQDVQKIDYQNTVLETDFQILRVLIQQRLFIISFRSIISIQTDDLYILICWRDDKKNSNNNMILKFEDEENRVLWTRCMTFSKLICESELKDRLFFKQDRITTNTMNVSGKQQSKWSQQQQNKQSPQKQSNNTKNLSTNLNINTNKSSAFDRLRRKSQYYPTLLNNGPNSLNGPKQRKVSEDLTLKQPFSKRLYNQKSQISFDDQLSVVYSNVGKKQQNQKSRKNSYLPSSKMQKLVEQKQKLQSEFKNQTQNSYSNKQLFYNQSSIHWIQQQNQQLKSKSSGMSKIKSVNRPTYQQIQSKEQSVKANSHHISQVPAQVQQSPLLPYNLREKRRNLKAYDGFQVKVHEVEKTSGYQKSNNSSHSKINKSGHKSSKIDDNQQYEQQNSDIEQIQSINQQLDDQQQSQQKISRKNRSNLQISDRSQDLVSQNQNSQTQSTKYGLDELKSGLILLKCSPNSWNPHRKKIHLSNNDTQLCWKNQRGDDLKKIFISDIEKIEYNKISPGVTKHIKNIQKRRCLAIKYKLKDEYKMLQFYLPQETNVKDLQNFYQKLETYVKFKNNSL